MGFKSLAVASLIVAACGGGAFLLADDERRASFLQAGSRLAGFAAGASSTDSDGSAAKKSVLRTVRIVYPSAAPPVTTLTLSGRTAPAEEALISSRASGIVSERFVDIGDHVETGALLVRIEAPEIEQELQRAAANVGQIEVRQKLASLELERAENLVTKGHVSVQTKDERYAAKLTAEADLIAARAEVKRLQEIVRFQDVRAPFAGTIVERRVERGNKIVASQAQRGDFLFRIARMDELRIEIDVPQSAALKIAPGTAAKVSFLEIPRERFAANVTRIANLIDPASGTMRIELLMKNPERRIPAGLNGEAILEVREEEGAVLVQNSTIVTRNGRQAVAIVDSNNRVRIRPVIVARDLGERIVISSGLDQEDRVIVSPNALLKEGDVVDIPPTDVAGEAS